MIETLDNYIKGDAFIEIYNTIDNQVLIIYDEKVFTEDKIEKFILLLKEFMDISRVYLLKKKDIIEKKLDVIDEGYI